MWRLGQISLALVAGACTVLQCSATTAGGFEAPYKGWSSWSLQATRYPGYGFLWLNETNMRHQASILAEYFVPYGYDRFNLDSGWSDGTDQYGRFVGSRAKFVDFPAFVSELTTMGLKVGLYLIPGVLCGDRDDRLGKRVFGTNYTIGEISLPLEANAFFGSRCRLDFTHPGAQAWVDAQVRMFADWGVDFVKLDGVIPGSSTPTDIPFNTLSDVVAYRSAIDRFGKGMWLTLSWALDVREPYLDIWESTADAFRIAIDIESYGDTLLQYSAVRRNVLAYKSVRSRGAGKNAYLDMDSLLVGSGQMSHLYPTERRTMMSMWILTGSPLYIGDDLSMIDRFGYELLTNREVLALHGRGPPASYLNPKDGSQRWCRQQIWYSRISPEQVLVGLVNLDGGWASDVSIGLDLKMIGESEVQQWEVRDLWMKRDLDDVQGLLHSTLQPHDTALFLLTKKTAWLRIQRSVWASFSEVRGRFSILGG
jgi:hypothetical protein